jgi:hypothetical protein
MLPPLSLRCDSAFRRAGDRTEEDGLEEDLERHPRSFMVGEMRTSRWSFGVTDSSASDQKPEKFCMIRMAPGPRITTNNAGRTQRMVGKRIFTGICIAERSAR